jgi:hypothetical protein
MRSRQAYRIEEVGKGHDLILLNRGQEGFDDSVSFLLGPHDNIVPDLPTG